VEDIAPLIAARSLPLIAQGALPVAVTEKEACLADRNRFASPVAADRRRGRGRRPEHHVLPNNWPPGACKPDAFRASRTRRLESASMQRRCCIRRREIAPVGAEMSDRQTIRCGVNSVRRDGHWSRKIGLLPARASRL